MAHRRERQGLKVEEISRYMARPASVEQQQASYGQHDWCGGGQAASVEPEKSPPGVERHGQ
jgi:hypothetical protein